MCTEFHVLFVPFLGSLDPSQSASPLVHLWSGTLPVLQVIPVLISIDNRLHHRHHHMSAFAYLVTAFLPSVHYGTMWAARVHVGGARLAQAQAHVQAQVHKSQAPIISENQEYQSINQLDKS